MELEGGGESGEAGMWGEEGVMSQERCVLILFWSCKDMAFAAFDEQKKPEFGLAVRTLCLSWPGVENMSPPAGTA